MKKKIGVFLNVPPEGGGAYQYSQCILDALLQSGYPLTIFYTDERWAVYLNEIGVKSVHLPYRRSTFLFQLVYRKIGLPALIFRYFLFRCFKEFRTLCSADVDYFFFPGQDPEGYLLNLKSISSIHDLMHIYEPRYAELRSKRIRDYHYKNMIRYCHDIMTDSELGRQHVLENYGTSLKNVHVVPFIAPRYIRDNQSSTKYPKIVEGNYLFYPAQFWSHKNHITVLHALQNIKDQSIKVVFSGAKKNAFQDICQFITTNQLEHRVEILGYVSDNEMLSLYQHCKAVIFASVCGPTNIPPIEAIMLNKPLICSNKYGMMKQCGDAAVYFNPLDSTELVHQIDNVLGNTTLRNKLIANAKSKSVLFSVDELARQLQNILDANK